MKKISLLLSALCMAFVGYTQSVKYVPFVDDFNESNGDSTLFIVGKGTFASSVSSTQNPRLAELLQQITPIIKELLYLGMSADEILEFIQIQLKGGTSID